MSKGKIIVGRVLPGEGLGRATGYPTANLPAELIAELKLGPGVYAAWGTIDKNGGAIHKSRLPAIVIVGTPYKFKHGAVKLEVYFLDFDKDISDLMVTAEIVEKIRPMADFDDLATLVERIKQDIAETRKILNTP